MNFELHISLIAILMTAAGTGLEETVGKVDKANSYITKFSTVVVTKPFLRKTTGRMNSEIAD